MIAEPVDGEDVRVDLVFVHGLSHNWQSTWNEDGLSWIQHLLPNDIPHARIFTCGFSPQVCSQKDPSLSFSGFRIMKGKGTIRRDLSSFLLTVLEVCSSKLFCSIAPSLFKRPPKASSSLVPPMPFNERSKGPDLHTPWRVSVSSSRTNISHI